jgi:hypothetical protein
MRKPHTRQRIILPDERMDPELDALLRQVDRRVDEGFLADLEAAFARGQEAEKPTAA